MPEVLTETSLHEIDEQVAALIEPKPPLAHCRSMHDTASPKGAWVHTHIYEHGYECEVVPRVFSSDIALAMRVVEKMWQAGWTIEMANCGKVGTLASDRIVNWYVRFIEDENDMNNWSAEADTVTRSDLPRSTKGSGE